MPAVVFMYIGSEVDQERRGNWGSFHLGGMY